MRFLLLLSLALAAHAASIQMSLDAFKFSAPGSKWALQIKMVNPDGTTSTRSVRLVNITLSNGLISLSPNSSMVSGSLEDGIVLNDLDTDRGVFISDLLTLVKGGSSLPSFLSFDLEDANTGRLISTDEFGLFLYEVLPGQSNPPGQSAFSVLGAVEAIGNLGDGFQTVTDQLTNPTAFNPGTSGSSGTTSGSTGGTTSGSSGTSGGTGPGPDPTALIDPSSAVPEPSTFLLLIIPLGLMLRKQ